MPIDTADLLVFLTAALTLNLTPSQSRSIARVFSVLCASLFLLLAPRLAFERR